MCFFALRMTTGLKIPGVVIPHRVFTQPRPIRNISGKRWRSLYPLVTWLRSGSPGETRAGDSRVKAFQIAPGGPWCVRRSACVGLLDRPRRERATARLPPPRSALRPSEPERFAKRQIPLAPRAPSIHGPERPILRCNRMSACGRKADSSGPRPSSAHHSASECPRYFYAILA